MVGKLCSATIGNTSGGMLLSFDIVLLLLGFSLFVVLFAQRCKTFYHPRIE